MKRAKGKQGKGGEVLGEGSDADVEVDEASDDDDTSNESGGSISKRKRKP